MENQKSLLEVLELEIASEKDFDIEIKQERAKRIPTKTVSLFLEDMEVRDTINQPFLFIILPFFTSKKQRAMNLRYEIKNAGITFGSSLSSDSFEGFRNKQPSEFEQNVFYFILYKFQELIAKNIDLNYVNFDINEVIEYLELAFSMKYYRKIEEVLYNLQATTYKFMMRNKKKSGKIIREVYNKPLNLIKYEKLKEKNLETNKQKVLYKVELDERILEELRIKHYSIFDRKHLNYIRKQDKVAEKIYQFISMKRFGDIDGEHRIETLAAIVPLSQFSRIKKILSTGEVKEYVVSKLKQVLNRISKAFDSLVELDYLTGYDIIELVDDNTYKIKYYFNIQKDGECHISDYVLKNKNNNKLLPENNKIIKKNNSIFNEEIELALENAKEKNIYFKSRYNKRTENKIKKIVKDGKENIILEIIKKLENFLNNSTKRSLVYYIENMYNEIENEEKRRIVMPKLTENKINNDTNIVNKKMLNDPINNLIWELYEKMDDNERNQTEEKARNMYMEENNIKEINGIYQKIYTSMKRAYVLKVIKKEKGII